MNLEKKKKRQATAPPTAFVKRGLVLPQQQQFLGWVGREVSAEWWGFVEG